jgi:hypothetical protein
MSPRKLVLLLRELEPKKQPEQTQSLSAYLNGGT